MTYTKIILPLTNITNFEFFQTSGNEHAIEVKVRELSQDSEMLQQLTNLREKTVEVAAEIQKQTQQEIDLAIKKKRQDEKVARMQVYSALESKKQKKTKELVSELLSVCELEETPVFVLAIAKVLEDYQGTIYTTWEIKQKWFWFIFIVIIPFISVGINTTRSKTQSIYEKVAHLTDQMRTFEEMQMKYFSIQEEMLKKVCCDFTLIFKTNYKSIELPCLNFSDRRYFIQIVCWS